MVLFMVVMSIRLPRRRALHGGVAADGVDAAGQVRPVGLEVDLAVDDVGCRSRSAAPPA